MEAATNTQQTNTALGPKKVFQVLGEIFTAELSGDKVWHYFYVSSPETFFFIILPEPLPFTHGADKTWQIAPLLIDSNRLEVSEALDQELQRDPRFLCAFQGSWEKVDPKQPNPNHSFLNLLQGTTESIRYKTFTLRKPVDIWDVGQEKLQGFKAQDQHAFSIWSHTTRARAIECAKEEVRDKKRRIERDQHIFIRLRDEKEEQWPDKRQWVVPGDERVGTSLERLYKSSERHFKFWTFVLEQIENNSPVLDKTTIDSFGMGPTDNVAEKIKKYRSPTSSTNITLQIKKITKITRREKNYLQIENLKDELHFWSHEFGKEINDLQELKNQLKESKNHIKCQDRLNSFDSSTQSEKLRLLGEDINSRQTEAFDKKLPQEDFQAEIKGFQTLCERLKENIVITDYKVFKKIEAFQEMNNTLSSVGDSQLLKRFSTDGHILIGRAKREKIDTDQLDEVHIKIKPK